MPSARALRFGKAVIELGLTGAADIDKALQRLQRKMRDFGTAMKSIGSQGLAMAGAIGAPLIAAVKIAADAQEGLAKFKSVFGDQADAADAFAQATADAIGRSVHEIRGAMSAYQAFFVGLGFGSEKSLEMSKQMQTLALDFAAFHNLADDESMGRFISAMSGSSEVMDQFGVNLKAAAIDQKFLEMGINETTQSATEQQKSLARLAIIMDSMGAQGAIGAAARESDSFANRLKALKAEMTDLAVEIGMQLMPRAIKFLKWARDAIQSISEWVAQNPAMAGALADLATGLGAAGAACLALGAALSAISAHPFVLLAIGAVYACKEIKALVDELTGVTAELTAINFLAEQMKLDQKNPLLKPMRGDAALQRLIGGEKDKPTAAGPQPPSAMAQLQSAGGNLWGEMQRAWLADQTKLAHERFMESRNLDDEIARERINAIKDEAARDKALIEFEKQQTMRSLQDRGLLDAQTQAKLDQLAEIQLANIPGEMPGSSTAMARSVFDTSKLDANFFGIPGNGIEDKQLAALEKIAKNTKQKPGGDVFGIPVN
jgi:hypothetical protein